MMIYSWRLMVVSYQHFLVRSSKTICVAKVPFYTPMKTTENIWFSDVCVCVCVCVCVFVHSLWSHHLSRTAGTAREQINDVVLKKLDSYTGSLHLYFGMQSLTFQLAALSCSYTRSGHSHELTSIHLPFRT